MKRVAVFIVSFLLFATVVSHGQSIKETIQENGELIGNTAVTHEVSYSSSGAYFSGTSSLSRDFRWRVENGDLPRRIVFWLQKGENSLPERFSMTIEFPESVYSSKTSVGWFTIVGYSNVVAFASMLRQLESKLSQWEQTAKIHQVSSLQKPVPGASFSLNYIHVSDQVYRFSRNEVQQIMFVGIINGGAESLSLQFTPFAAFARARNEEQKKRFSYSYDDFEYYEPVPEDKNRSEMQWFLIKRTRFVLGDLKSLNSVLDPAAAARSLVLRRNELLKQEETKNKHFQDASDLFQ